MNQVKVLDIVPRKVVSEGSQIENTSSRAQPKGKYSHYLLCIATGVVRIEQEFPAPAKFLLVERSGAVDMLFMSWSEIHKIRRAVRCFVVKWEPSIKSPKAISIPLYSRRPLISRSIARNLNNSHEIRFAMNTLPGNQHLRSMWSPKRHRYASLQKRQLLMHASSILYALKSYTLTL
jgi:hypothetical protein